MYYTKKSLDPNITSQNENNNDEDNDLMMDSELEENVIDDGQQVLKSVKRLGII